MGVFGDKPENQASQESISPQMVESVKIRYWEVQYYNGPPKTEYKIIGYEEISFFSLSPRKPIEERHTSYPNSGWILNVTAIVTLKGNLTVGGAEVGFFLNYNLLGTASCDEWGKVSLCKRFHNTEQLIPKNGDKLTVRIKGTAIEDEVVLTLDNYRRGRMA